MSGSSPPSNEGVILVNPSSGPDDTGVDDLAPQFGRAVIIETDGGDVDELVRKAIDGGVSAVGVAGGDGTIRVAAGILAGSMVPLVPIPAGTRNHFARELGIETIELAASAWAGNETKKVDLGEVNGECFVNNASIGSYPALVRERELHERRMPKFFAQLVAAWAQVRKGHRFTVRIDGASYRTWLVFVGNGLYGERLSDFMVRERLDANVLDVRVLLADRRLARTRAVLTVMFGRLGRSALLENVTPSELVIEVEGRRHVDVALDGEVVALKNPLTFRSLAGALMVKVPSPSRGRVDA